MLNYKRVKEVDHLTAMRQLMEGKVVEVTHQGGSVNVLHKIEKVAGVFFISYYNEAERAWDGCECLHHNFLNSTFFEMEEVKQVVPPFRTKTGLEFTWDDVLFYMLDNKSGIYLKAMLLLKPQETVYILEGDELQKFREYLKLYI